LFDSTNDRPPAQLRLEHALARARSAAAEKKTPPIGGPLSVLGCRSGGLLLRYLRKIVYTAGQLARDVDGNCVGKGDMRAQMEQTFQNLDRCLKAAGATWADVVKTNTFVTDFDEFQKCADIRVRYLGVATPTSTTVGVTRLAGPDFMIEIEAVAVVNS
jgi:2-iminobutanoate/2-iminopropanoate deaminase